MAKSELCKSCAHTKVCMKDKNVCGDAFVAGNPMIFDNNELLEKYKEWEAKGFPCEDYLSAADMVDKEWEAKGFPCEDSLFAADMVYKERYARLLANAIIVCDALKEYQAADMVEVVRCKDCKHRKGTFHTDRRRKEGGYWVYWCELDTGDPFELGRNAEDDNWFCADGERKEE